MNSPLVSKRMHEVQLVLQELLRAHQLPTVAARRLLYSLHTRYLDDSVRLCQTFTSTVLILRCRYVREFAIDVVLLVDHSRIVQLA